MEVPVGVVIIGKVTGLDIEYEMSDEMAEQLNSQRTNVNSLRKSRSDFFRHNQSKSTSFAENNFVIDKSLKSIDLKHVKVNKPSHFSFKVRNISGIHTSFNIYCKNFFFDKNKMPSKMKDSLMESIVTSNTQTNVNLTESFKTTRRSLNKNLKGESLTHTMLSDAHEELNFSSSKGNEFNKMKLVEKESGIYLSNRKGVAILIEPTQGRLKANSEVTVNVTIYNEIVGNFSDELVSEVKGLSPKIFPIGLKIRGNPVQLCPFLPGLNYTSDPPLMKMGHVLANTNIIEKRIKLVNTGFNPLTIDWKVYDYMDILAPKGDIVNIKITEIQTRKFSLSFNTLPSKESTGDKQSFQVLPKNATINPKSVKDFTVIFHAYTSGLNSALIVAHPKLAESEELSQIKMTELAIKVDAYGVIPELVVDKKV